MSEDPPPAEPGDDRVACHECKALRKLDKGDRVCGVAVRGQRLDVPRSFAPVLYLRHACEFFIPKDGAFDKRTGAQRFPQLWSAYQAARPELQAASRRRKEHDEQRKRNATEYDAAQASRAPARDRATEDSDWRTDPEA